LAIAKMTRVFMAGASTRKEELLRFLQQSGVVHMEPLVPLAGDPEKQVSSVLLHLRRIGHVQQEIARHGSHGRTIPADCSDEALVGYAEETHTSLHALIVKRQRLARLAEELVPWGDFDCDQIRLLEANGLHLQRWLVERGSFEELHLPENVYYGRVAENPVPLFYTLSCSGPVDLPAACPLPLPEMGLAGICGEIEKLTADMEILQARLAGVALRREVLKAELAATLTEAKFLEQMGTLYSEEYLFGVAGWIPTVRLADFLREIEAQRLPLAVETRDPLPEEEPPVLLKNNRFIQRIEPLLKLYGNPQYRDIDPSGFFAPFMILFFGICLSDAGYGLAFYMTAVFIGRRWEHVAGLPPVVKLCKVFALASIAVGLLTGSIFGHNFEGRQWILLDVDVNKGNPMLLFYLAIGLGILHQTLSLLLGILQSAYLHLKLQKIGLIGVLWGGVLLIGRNIWAASPDAPLYTPLSYAGVGLLALGLLLTLLFSSNSPRWAVRFGLGLWGVYGLTALIGDLLSYARLFGLGIATSAIAAVMNQLAGMVREAAGPILGHVLAVLVIVVGHSFNLALSILGSTIHSTRLHFVEAFKNFFEGGGVEYKPFKIERG
jgi:V/A-type H+-transporting ATPase subunit I